MFLSRDDWKPPCEVILSNLLWTFLNFYAEFYASSEDFSFLKDIATSVAGFMFLYSPVDSISSLSGNQ